MSIFRKRNFKINRDGVKVLTAEWTGDREPVVTFYIDGVEVARAGLDELKGGFRFNAPNGTPVEVFAARGIPWLIFGIRWNGKISHGSADPEWNVYFWAALALLSGIMGMIGPFLPHASHHIDFFHRIFGTIMSAVFLFISFHIFKKSADAVKALGIIMTANLIYSWDSQWHMIRKEFPPPMLPLIAFQQILIVLIFANLLWYAIQYLEAAQLKVAEE